LIASRIGFANGIHMAEEYNLAMNILDIILAKNPKHVDVLCLYGDILWHLGKPLDAIKFAKKALTYGRENIQAFHVLCDSYESLKDWRLMLKWSSHGIQAAETIHEDLFFKRDYINALIGLGKIEAAKKAFLAVKQEMGKRPLPRFLKVVEAELKKKAGKRK